MAEVVSEIAAARGKFFDARATGLAFARAALADPAFKDHLAEIHERILARRALNVPRHLLVSFNPLFHDLEEEAARVLRRAEP